MFKRIAVLLDGSPLAEQAIPVALQLAHYLKASVILLHTIELPPIKVRQEASDAAVLKAAQIYLQGVCDDILNSKLAPPFEENQLDYRIIFDEKPKHLAQVAADEKADLLVITTHGRTGFSRLVMGSIATSIVKNSSLPVVLVRPQQSATDQTHSLLPGGNNWEAIPFDLKNNPTRIVVPLDSLADSENSLPIATALAKQLDATIYLLNVVALSESLEKDADDDSAYLSNLSSVNTPTLIQGWKDEVFHYLEVVQERLEMKGLKVVKVVRIGDPAEQIADFINLAQPSLLVMATHARDRLGRALQGNLPEKVLSLSKQPVVMVHT